jgi:hypothetical protein
MVEGSAGECQVEGQAVVRAALKLPGVTEEAFDEDMQDNFREGVADSISVPVDNVAIRSYYVEESSRRRRLLEAGLVVNVAITADEEDVAKVVTDMRIVVANGDLKKSLEAAGLEGIGDLVFEQEPVAVSSEGIVRVRSPNDSDDGDSSLLITLIVVLTVVMVGVGIVMLTFHIMNRTKNDATVHMEEVIAKVPVKPALEAPEAPQEPEEQPQEAQPVGSDFAAISRSSEDVQARAAQIRTEPPLLVRSMTSNGDALEKAADTIKGPPSGRLGGSSSVAPVTSSSEAVAQGPPVSLLSGMTSKSLPQVKVSAGTKGVSQMPTLIKVPHGGGDLMKVKLPPLPGAPTSASNSPRSPVFKKSPCPDSNL